MLQKFCFLLAFVLLVNCHFLFAQDPLLEILEKELNREFAELKKQEIPAYYIAYRVSDIEVVEINGSHGGLESNRRVTNRILTPMVRVGTPERDNFHPMRGSVGFNFLGITELPLENNELAISQLLWQATNTSYQNALNQYGRIKGSTATNAAEEDKSPDFTKVEQTKYLDPVEKIVVDKKLEDILIGKVMKLSAPFYNNVFAINSSVKYSINSIRKYFIDTDGTRIAENRNYIELSISCTGIAKDGMDLPQFKSYFADNFNELPSDEEILSEVKRMIDKLIAMRKSPVVEAYSGPALLSGSATGVFFHEIFGHRIEASRMKTVDDAQTYKKKVGEQVLNPALSVIFDPTLTKYKGFSMNGSYKYDDEGVMGKRTVVVEDGILKDFLTSRTPIDGFMQSNGHGRAMEAALPVSRQSNLLLESKKHYTEKELRELFMAELKKQNLEFGYFFKEVSGGFTTTTRYNPNAFNVTPNEVYRVYADGRPDELVRGVNLVGTPLAIFSEVEAVGGDYGLFNGYCGAESGRVPVSSVCPMMFVKKIELQKKPIQAGNTPPIDMPQ
jgi:predicted Zn-dependent protease